MKIGYIASHIYLHTFEINEVTELLRQCPDARVYSFYRPRGERLQRERMAAFPAEIISWSFGGIARASIRLALRHPLGVVRGALALAIRSLPNPAYWLKNTAVFFIALPIIDDAASSGVTHLHANFGSSPATVAWLGRKMLGLGMSVTYHAFDIYSQKPSLRDPLKRRKLEDADLVVTVHEDGRRVLRDLVPEVDADKFTVIRICVTFEPEDRPASPSAPPLVLAAGNLVEKKGFDVLVRAVAALKRRAIPVRARILGEGPERPALASLAANLRVGDCVTLPGYFQHRELARHLAEAAVFVVPSKVTSSGQRDGIPTVLVEAWLARTPVVASPVGGMSEVLEGESNALVFEPGDAEGLADQLARLVASPELQRSLAEKGHRTAREAFACSENVRALLREIRGHTAPRCVS